MKRILPITLLAIIVMSSYIREKESFSTRTPVSPLASYSNDWNDPKYLKCNTAKGVGYLSPAEKDLIYILNLARINPLLFANTVLKKYPENEFRQQVKHSWYYQSLLDTMLHLKPAPLVYPDSLCYRSARCHAVYSGQEGTVGHDRTTECKKYIYFNGECCDYGNKDPLEIILSLLIDEGIPSLGHRRICLGSYNKLGVSIATHKVYRHMAVLDFRY